MTKPLTEEELRRVREFLTHEGLEAFLPYAEQAAAEAKLSMAKRLVWKSYRQMFVSFVALVVAVATFWDHLSRGLTGYLKWLIGN